MSETEAILGMDVGSDPQVWEAMIGKECIFPWGDTQIKCRVASVIVVPSTAPPYYIVPLEIIPEDGWDDEWQEMDGNLWILPRVEEGVPCSATRVQKVVDPNAFFMMEVVGGSGFYVTEDARRLPSFTEMNSVADERKPVFAELGSFVVLVADPGGMVVLGLNIPKFRPDMEIEYTEDGPVGQVVEGERNATPSFWNIVRNLRTRGGTRTGPVR